MKYYDCTKLRICRGNQKPLLDVKTEEGLLYEALEPRMFFPVCHRDRIISLKKVNTETGKETDLFTLKDIGNLDENSRISLKEALDFYYLIPIIESIEKSKYQRGNLHWCVITNKGDYEIDINSPMHNIRMEGDGTVYVRDIRDNRYEIKELQKLSKKTQRAIMKFL